MLFIYCYNLPLLVYKETKSDESWFQVASCNDAVRNQHAHETLSFVHTHSGSSLEQQTSLALIIYPTLPPRHHLIAQSTPLRRVPCHCELANGHRTMSSTSNAHASQRMSRDRRHIRREQLLTDFFDKPVQTLRYKVEKVIGKGAYGVVVAALDTQTGKRVAVKRIKHVLQSPAMATRILRELKFLRLLNVHENIVSVTDVLIPSQLDQFNDVFVVMELMPTDLGRLLRSKTVLQERHVKFFMFQLLRAVNFLHAAHVFHRDLNPSNILVNSDCELRVCDFGLARVAFQHTDDHVFWTDYVATRLYRAPELILANSSQYSTAIDMWSVGCIFAEMLGRGKPLFPGRDTWEQFALILNVTGKPSRDVIEQLDPRLAEYIDKVPSKPPALLSAIYQDASPGAIQLLGKLLAFDPNERITAADALALPFFEDFRSVDLGASIKPLEEQLFAFERRLLPAPEMRREFLLEIGEYHPEARHELLGTNGDREHGGRRGQYMVPSQAQQFAEDMIRTEASQQQKNRTLSTDVFAEINPVTEGGRAQQDRSLKGSTMGEAELQRFGGAPTHHASSFATHAQSLQSADASSMMQD